MQVPGGWQTHLAVLRLEGARIEDRGAYRAVVTVGNPRYHWGNFLLVTDPVARHDAGGWLAEFREWFPRAGHVAIGLPAEPDPEPWRHAGVAVEAELVLAAPRPCAPRPLASGYQVHQLVSDADWAGAVDADVADRQAGGGEPEGGFEAYLRARYSARRAMSERGDAAFFGAFASDGTLVTRLGIVLCGPILDARQVARYQHVGTRVAHRGRGLAGHLLGVAAAWAAQRGADRWEIHADPDGDAHRLYTALGFTEEGRSWMAYRAPRPTDPVSR
jgi:GNAT superfamily N-acetyltransferase